MRFGWLDQKRCAQFAFAVDKDHAPVVESALPKLPEIDLDLMGPIVVFGHISGGNSVPSKN